MSVNAYKLATRTGLTTLQNNNSIGSNKVVGTGSIHVVKFSGLNPGDSINSVALNVSVANGNVRVKVYDEVASEPTNLLGQSGTLAVGGTGIQTFSLTAPATVPSNGIVWAGFETDSATLDLVYLTGASGNEKTVVHTYGVGADPFGSPTNGTDVWNIILALNGSGIIVNRTGKIKHIYVAVAGSGSSTLGLNSGIIPSANLIYKADGFDVIVPHTDLDISFSNALYAEISGDAEFNIMYE